MQIVNFRKEGYEIIQNSKAATRHRGREGSMKSGMAALPRITARKLTRAPLVLPQAAERHQLPILPMGVMEAREAAQLTPLWPIIFDGLSRNSFKPDDKFILASFFFLSFFFLPPSHVQN